jgi:threonine aldolase
MADAEVGDAWYDDDPTVNELQEVAADLTGMESALYVPTGTMANQIALALHVQGNGHLVACSRDAHVATTEVMTSAALSGISFRTAAAGPKGWLTPELARELLEPDAYYDVEVVDLLSLENTVGAAGGTIAPVDMFGQVRRIADEAGVAVHLDGARIFNAAVAADEPVTAWTDHVDTVMFCVSKGLGAPIGSLLCGPAELLREGRRLSILFGGGWRQAGIMAAAGLLALREGRVRLADDHERARRLATGLGEILPPGSVDLDQVETNMVYVDTRAIGWPVLEALDRLANAGIAATHAAGRVRLVTHLDVDDEGVDLTLDVWRTILADARPTDVR